MNEQAKQDKTKEAKQVYRELVTINGKNVVLAHNEPPVINAGVLENGDIFRLINIFADKFTPTNIDKADGTPLRLYTSDRVKVDVSKRRKYDMGFWHRNIDAHEIIFCVKGALKWETEMGIKIMHEGDMLFIPKGIGHRSMLCEDSTDENVLIELKIADDLTYVGEGGKMTRIVPQRTLPRAAVGRVAREGAGWGALTAMEGPPPPTPPHRCAGGGGRSAWCGKTSG